MATYFKKHHRNFVISTIEADGYCFYHAVRALLVGDSIPTVQQLRKDAIAFLINEYRRPDGIQQWVTFETDDRDQEFVELLQALVDSTYRGRMGDLAIAHFWKLFKDPFPSIVYLTLKGNDVLGDTRGLDCRFPRGQ
jgi:hypothetical protein